MELSKITKICYYSIAGALAIMILYSMIGGISYGYIFTAHYNVVGEAYIEIAIIAWEVIFTFIIMVSK